MFIRTVIANRIAGLYEYYEAFGPHRAPLVLLPTERRNEKSREYRHVEPVCTVQQKNREGNQHSHLGRGLINQFQMGVPNGELMVMYTTSSYHMYLSLIHI